MLMWCLHLRKVLKGFRLGLFCGWVGGLDLLVWLCKESLGCKEIGCWLRKAASHGFSSVVSWCFRWDEASFREGGSGVKNSTFQSKGGGYWECDLHWLAVAGKEFNCVDRPVLSVVVAVVGAVAVAVAGVGGGWVVVGVAALIPWCKDWKASLTGFECGLQWWLYIIPELWKSVMYCEIW